MKRMMTLLLVLCMVVSALPLRVSAATVDSGICGDNLTWVLDERGILTISGEGDMYDYEVWQSPWYPYAEQITAVEMEEGITSIGDHAFLWCSCMTYAVIPESVAEIGTYAFAYCESLTQAELPDGLISLEDGAFKDCMSMTEFYLGANVASIGQDVFAQCTGLSAIHVDSANKHYVSDDHGALYDKAKTNLIQVPAMFAGHFEICDSVETVSYTAFWGCELLTEVTIGRGVQMIGSLAFNGCFGLNTFYVHPENEFYSTDDRGVLYDLDKTTLVRAPLTLSGHYRVPDSVTWIGEYAFSYCANLESLTLSDLITEICDESFCGCSSLTEITIPFAVRNMGYCAFAYCDSLREVRFRGNLPQLHEMAFFGSEFTVYYPEGDSTWTKAALQDYGGTINWQPHTVEYRVLDQGSCGENLTWKMMENGVLVISGSGAMYDYENGTPWESYQAIITDLELAEGITYIGTKAFENLWHLGAVTIPGSVETIGNRAFWSCYEMKELTISEGVRTIREAAFMSCVSLKHVKIPDSMTTIESLAFWNCSALYSIEMNPGDTTPLDPVEGGGVQVLLPNPEGGLREVYIGRNVSYIGPEAFSNCKQLTGIYVDSRNKHYCSDERGVLFDKEKTTLVQAPGGLTGHYRIPEGVTTVGEWALAICPDLTQITVPASVTRIGIYAFSARPTLTFDFSSKLEEICFEGNAPQIGYGAFWEVEAACRYPAGNPTWTQSVMQDYLGYLTWKPDSTRITEIARGWSGATQWTLSSDGTLTVYGKGNMKNYGYEGGQPWLKYADRIRYVIIEEGVTAVGSGAFMGLTRLENVKFPETGLTRIGEASFYGCTALNSVTIPEGIYTVWNYTFKNCTALKSVKLPKTLIKVDQGAFENCTSLTFITIPKDVNIIGSWSFKGSTGLVAVDLSASCATKIREGAFKNCSALTTIHLPANIQTLGDSCFYGIGATSFTVPDTVTSIEAWCFARAYSLTKIYFESDAPTIGQGAFNKITLTAYYPRNNTTWTSAVKQNYGGTVTWSAWK